MTAGSQWVYHMQFHWHAFAYINGLLFWSLIFGTLRVALHRPCEFPLFPSFVFAIFCSVLVFFSLYFLDSCASFCFVYYRPTPFLLKCIEPNNFHTLYMYSWSCDILLFCIQSIRNHFILHNVYSFQFVFVCIWLCCQLFTVFSFATYTCTYVYGLLSFSRAV